MMAASRPTSVNLRAAHPDDEDAVRALLVENGLQSHFHADQFLVATDDGNRIVGCGRLRPLADGTHEIASVAIASTHRGHGLGATMVETLIARAGSHRVYGLSLVPGFLLKLGFSALDKVPNVLQERADGACGSYHYVPMVRG